VVDRSLVLPGRSQYHCLFASTVTIAIDTQEDTVMFGLYRALLLAGLPALAAPAAHALTLDFDTPFGMNGAQEVPANGSPGTGYGQVWLDPIGHLLQVHMIWSDLVATPSASHIHVGSGPGTNGPVAIPFLGLPATTSGTYDHSFDLSLSSSYGGGFLTASGGTAAGAEAALEAGLLGRRAYMNIHNPTFPGGEIRGNIAPVPEPTPLVLVGLGLGMAALVRKRFV
jgi:hypothetical protein